MFEKKFDYSAVPLALCNRMRRSRRIQGFPKQFVIHAKQFVIHANQQQQSRLITQGRNQNRVNEN